jgi:hypothetical protein
MRREVSVNVRMGGWLALGAAVVASTLNMRAQQPTIQPTPQPALPLEPARERGQSVSPAYEGWYQNADGSFNLLIGYYNRNSRQPFDIPVGPNNMIAPGDADQGQPTHFETGRQWGVFTIKVPRDFGTKTITWTIISNGEKQSIPFSLNKAYQVTPFKDLAMQNEPPKLWFAEGGPKFQGPPMAAAATLTGTVNQPVTLNVWAEDPKGIDTGRSGRGGAQPIAASLSFHKYRGPGDVTFKNARLPVAKQGEMASTTATFSAPGAYTLRVQANDESGEGGGGFQCCWTNAYVKVTIK